MFGNGGTWCGCDKEKRTGKEKVGGQNRAGRRGANRRITLTRVHNRKEKRCLARHRSDRFREAD